MNREKLKDLYNHYSLTADDVFKHQHYVIITRQGIEKIQAHENITVTYEVIKCEPNFAVVKAAANINEKNKIETFGSATKSNCNSTYYMEMAQKRAKSRCVLEITSFYSLGVYSDVEVDEWNHMHKSNQ